MSGAGPRMVSVAATLRDATRTLGVAGVASASLDAHLLLGHIVGADRAALIRRANEPLDGRAREAFAVLIGRRAAREPVSRILGGREFFGRTFHLGRGILDPRPDTETLVEVALGEMAGRRGEALSILDLGTGSGALLVTLLAELANATGVGVDIDRHAVEVAAANARAHGVSRRALFVAGDWDGALSGTFDLIVANPPYIATGDLGGLAPEVRDYDPPAALDGGPDGLAGHRAVATAAARLLEPGRGTLAVEIGWHQARAVGRLMRARGLELDLRRGVHRDLAGRERVLVARRAAGAGGDK